MVRENKMKFETLFYFCSFLNLKWKSFGGRIDRLINSRVTVPVFDSVRIDMRSGSQPASWGGCEWVKRKKYLLD